MPTTITPAVRKKILDAAIAAEQDASADLSVAMLADLVEMSEKHFQRCFRAVLGESPKKYVRRIRLQAAAYLLKWSDASIVDLAHHSGFDTHAGFTKAFTKLYGQSPLHFRQSSSVVPYLEFPIKRSNGFDLESARATQLVVRLEEQPDYRVAAMRYVGPVEKMASIWQTMNAWAKQNNLLHPETITLGIHHDYWDPHAEDKYRYDAAIVIPDDFEVDDQVNTFVIPGGTVAKTEFSGSLEQADRCWTRFADQWLPASGYQFRGRFAFDHYPVEIITAGRIKQILLAITGFRATLCMPVKK